MFAAALHPPVINVVPEKATCPAAVPVVVPVITESPIPPILSEVNGSPLNLVVSAVAVVVPPLELTVNNPKTNLPIFV